MTKQAWAKGRKEKNFVLAVDAATRDLARELAIEYRVTIKDMVSISLVHYALTKQEKK